MPRLARLLPFVAVPFVAVALAAAPAAAVEVSRYTFDATLADGVGSNDGALHGGIPPAFVAGQGGAGSAIALDGLDDYVELLMEHDLPIVAKPRYSVAGWVKGARGARRVLYSEASTAGAGPLFQIGFDPSGATGRVHVTVRPIAGAPLVDALVSSRDVLDGAWHHVAWVDDAGSGRIYVDGVADGTVAYAKPATWPVLDRALIGATWAIDPCCFFEGAIDDLRIFDHALSADEVRAMVPVPCPAVSITAVAPGDVLTTGGTPFTISGTGFVSGQHFGTIGGQPLTEQVVTPGTPISTIRGKSPPLAEGFHVLNVICAGGETAGVWPRNVRAVAPLGPVISTVSPRQVSTRGGDTVDVVGAEFTAGMELAMLDAAGAEIVLPFSFRNGDNLSFVTPPHAAGVVDLRATVAGAPAHRARGVLQYISPDLEIRSFTPAHADARGGETLFVHGRNFQATTQLVIVDLDAAGIDFEEIEIESATDTLLTALLPDHEPGRFRVGVRPRDGVDPIFAPGTLEFVAASAPAPEEVEGTLVDGIAEIEWVNPVPYARVHVYRDGAFHGTIEGNANFFRDPTAVDGDDVEYALVGEVDRGGSGSTLFRVARPACVTPANVSSGMTGDKIFHLYGGHRSLDDPGIPLPDVPDAIDPVSGDDGGYKFITLNAESGQPQIEFDTSLLATAAPNELVTGFRIVETTRKLRIGVHAANIAAAESLSLRVLIEPAESGLSRDPVELTLPRVPLGPAHGWIVVDYNTENPPPPGSPVPDPDPAEQLPPHDPFAPGTYLLKVYAVGGVPLQAYYEVSSDRSDEQILVPGAGCPPYPLVRVEPTNNFHPTIHGIHQVPGSVTEIGSVTESDGTVVPILTATIEAEVTDLDGDPIVKHIWDVHNGQQIDHKESASNKFNLFFYGYGTHSAKLTVWDNRCGNTTEMNIPVTIHPPCVPIANSPNFSFPSPVPSSLHFVTDLDSLDAFDDEVEQTFRVFVVDPQAGDDCLGGPATTRRVEMGLFRAGGPANLNGAGTSGNKAIQVHAARLQGIYADQRECLISQFTNPPGTGLDDESRPCTFDAGAGGLFWVATFDMGSLPRVDPGTAGGTGVYELWARGDSSLQGNSFSAWRRVQPFHRKEVSGVEIWTTTPGSQSIRVYDPPASFDHAPHTSGSWDPRSRTYDFAASLAPPGSGTGIHQSTEVTEGFEGIDFNFPSSSNGLSSAEATVYATFSKGVWTLERLRKGYDAFALGKRFRNRADIPGAALDIAQAASGSACDLKAFRDCSFEALVDQGKDIPLFKVPLLTDPFGGVLFTASFSAGVSAFFTVSIGHDVSFDPCAINNDSPFDASFVFDFEGGIGFFAEIDTDVLLGIGSLDIGVDFGLNAQLPVVLDVASFSAPEFGFRMGMDVTGYIEVCGLWVFCAEEEWPIYHDDILEVPSDVDLDPLFDKINFLRQQCGSAAGAPAGAAAGEVQLNAPSRHLTIDTSPNGFRQIAVGRRDSGKLFYIVKGSQQDWQWPPEDVELPQAQTTEYSGSQADPEVVFMTNDKILLVWTQDFSREDAALAGITEADLADPQILNAVSRRTEIVYSIGTWSFLPNPQPDSPLLSYVQWSTAQRLSDDQGPNGYRADGKVSLALDPTTVGGPNGPGVWAAWVRYETPDMVALDSGNDLAVDLHQTSVYARQIFTAFAAPRVKISGAADEIDISPDVAVADDGATFMVWLHDPVHEDLLEENVGRQILWSRRTGNNTLSAPAPVLADPLAFKGILEPRVALADDGHGILVFTALPSNAEEDDAGFGSARVLYSVTITDADTTTPDFGTPLLIGLKCDTAIYAHAPDIRFWRQGGDVRYVLSFQERGAIGSREGAGNAIAMVYDAGAARWGEPVNLTPDDRVHQGIAATVTSLGEIVLMHQSPSPWRPGLLPGGARGAGQGGIGGDPVPEPVLGGQLFGDLMGQSFPAVGDAAVSVCRISDVYAGAGADLVATIHVANRGLAPTPDGLALTIWHVVDGERETVERVALSPIAPGDEAVLEIPFAMPRQPILFVAIVDAVEGEYDPSDNERVCALGAQRPQDLAGEPVIVGGDRAVVLRWTNTSLYDRVLIYRDGRMLAETPGTRSSYVDIGTVGIDPRAGAVASHEYCVRGAIGLSQSAKSEPITVELPPEPPPPPEGPRYIRSDANADGSTDISDAVYTLAWLFTGGPAPVCEAASDSNADLAIDISDAAYTLGHLFLGGPPPRAPYPDCGLDPQPAGAGPSCRVWTICEE